MTAVDGLFPLVGGWLTVIKVKRLKLIHLYPATYTCHVDDQVGASRKGPGDVQEIG